MLPRLSGNRLSKSGLSEGWTSVMNIFERASYMSIIVFMCASSGILCDDSGAVEVDLGNVTRSNIPNVTACAAKKALTFKSAEPSPAGEPFFHAAYEFNVAKDGLYRVVIQGPGSGSRNYSRYSMAIDGGEPVPVLSRRVVAPDENPHVCHEQGPFKLAAGKHTLEFRFHPDQRMRDMNRVTEKLVGHNVKIDAVRVEEVPADSGPQSPARKDDRKLLLKGGDTIVLLGDSITDEGFYARHFVRLLQKAYPGESFTVVNSGIALNRTMEGLERLDLDVIALRPQWAVIAFGVNDAVHIAPDEFIKNYREIITRLKGSGIKVLCATPSGMTPGPDPDGKYFHTPDRARGFDATMALESGAIIGLANEMDCPCADVFGAFTRAGIDRKTTMANQWHPNMEGGRLYALALLRALGFSEQDAARTQEPADLQFYKAIAGMPPVAYPKYNPVSSTADGKDTGPWVAVSSFTENTVYAFSLETGKLAASAAVGHHPMGLAYNPKLKELYVACEGSGRLDVISIPTFKKTGTIELGDVYPGSIALSGDGETAWTANFFGSSVSEIDLPGRRIRRTLPIKNLGEAVILAQDGKTLLAATRDITICIDLQKWEIAGKIKTSEYGSAFFKDGKGQISNVDTAKWTMCPIDVEKKIVLPPVPAPYPARALIADPRTGDILAGDCDKNEIVRISASNAEVRKLADVQFPFGMAIIDHEPK